MTIIESNLFLSPKSISKEKNLLRILNTQSLPIKLLKEPEVLVLLLITLCYFVVNPIGQYAIDDDWIFVKSLRHLHQDGELKILAWNPMALVSLLLWGLPFTKLFGFTFTISKISVVVLLYVECLALIAILRKMMASTELILLVCLTLIFNPLHFFHSFLYGTDVPALSWGWLAVLFYLSGSKAIDQKSHVGLLFVGSILGALSLLARQNGILFPLAFLFYTLFWFPAKLKSFHYLTAAFGMPLVTAIGFQFWYIYIHGPTEAYLKSIGSIASWLGQTSPTLFCSWLFFFLIYIGFFIAPLALSMPLGLLQPKPLKQWMAFGLFSIFVVIMFLLITLYTGILFPYFPNKLTPFGFLSPNEVIVGNRPVLWGKEVSWIVSLLCILGVLVFAFQFSQVKEGSDNKSFRCSVRRLLSILLALQLGYLYATAKMLYDRHLLILLPTILVLFASVISVPVVLSKLKFFTLLIPLAIYSIAGTHDVHAFSRAAFSAGERLINAGIDPMWIDGGVAFDGWKMYESSRAERIDRSREHDAWWVRELIPGICTRFVISLSPWVALPELGGFWRKSQGFTTPSLENYDIYETSSYQTYWPFQKQTLYVMKEKVLEAKGSQKPERSR